MVHRERMKGTTRATWLARIEEWRRSGKSAEAFSEGQPFSGGTLTWRASQMKREVGLERKARASRKRSSAGESKVVFAEVIRRKGPDPGTSLTVEIGSARISVDAGFDGALLREVVRALRESGL